MRSFLNHGDISVVGVDSANRKVIYSICIPYTLLTSVTSSLLKSGSLDNLKLLDSLSVWQQEITNNDIKPEFLQKHPNLGNDVWVRLKKHLEMSMAYYVDICHILSDPNIISTILPIGVYVSVNYTCNIDMVIYTLEDLQKYLTVAGVSEFQLSLASALDETLKHLD